LGLPKKTGQGGLGIPPALKDDTSGPDGTVKGYPFGTERISMGIDGGCPVPDSKPEVFREGPETPPGPAGGRKEGPQIGVPFRIQGKDGPVEPNGTEGLQGMSPDKVPEGIGKTKPGNGNQGFPPGPIDSDIPDVQSAEERGSHGPIFYFPVNNAFGPDQEPVPEFGHPALHGALQGTQQQGGQGHQGQEDEKLYAKTKYTVNLFFFDFTGFFSGDPNHSLSLIILISA
jgi:hypothetical protein